MVKYLCGGFGGEGYRKESFDLSGVDIGKLAMALVDAATIVIGTPTVVAGLHPKVAYAVFSSREMFRGLGCKYTSVIGSYSWGGRAKEDILNMVPNLKVEGVIEPVICKGMPRRG